ncbi:MAG: hypothetical protein A2126_01375 [Candidatus Woykebacteria bacterium GWB1_45_5]|uniref:Sodium/calcium exchanger membrane region domain-containing protein n=1 Tax=Candidatus Woykebacteria bacterium GWB1_45_5 TaxID=1802592 RepID=A0A1G1W7T4_9BACT|nr:MAG: hypothetical protein A2126_01375 [Candidatus Woykebacteria bacterium GWB1_45_5]
MFLSSLFIYIFSFIFVWFGAGLIVSAVDKFSHRLKLSSFAFSFLVLGFLTSIPEIAVGINSLAEDRPEIFVGNLLGGIVVMFLLVIPLLAVLGKGIHLTDHLQGKNLLITLAVIAAPFLIVIDKKITNPEAILLMFFYLVTLYLVESKRGFIEKIEEVVEGFQHIGIFKEISKLLIGVVIVFISSHFIVEKTVYFSEVFSISQFLISLTLLSIGTNVPELSIAIKSVFSGKKQVAFGDYIGSASANILLLGVFSLIHNGEVLTGNRFLIPFLFVILGLGLFYIFSQSKNLLSRKEGFVLLSIYVLFLLYELVRI